MCSLSILRKKIREEQSFFQREVVAPVVPGGKIRVGMGKFRMDCPANPDFRGWGVFRILPTYSARLVREAEPWEKAEYASKFPSMALTLLQQLQEGSWQAFHQPTKDFFIICLVEGQAIFDEVIAANDGMHCWFVSGKRDNNHNKTLALRESLAGFIEPGSLSIPRLSARDVLLYRLALALNQGEEKDLEKLKIRSAIEMGGGQLMSYTRQAGGFAIKWIKGRRTFDSFIAPDLSVLSAGYCLSGRDREQDLTTLASLSPTV